MTPIEVLRERVERGAAFLDEHEQRWWKLIQEERLDLSDPCDCVLGQIHGSYSRGLAKLADDLGSEWGTDVKHGFELSVIDGNAWASLDALWLEAIAQRKNQGDMAQCRIMEVGT